MPARARLLCSLLSMFVAAALCVPLASVAQAAPCKQVSGHTLSGGYAGFVCSSKSRVHKPKRPASRPSAPAPVVAEVPPAPLDRVMSGSSQLDAALDAVVPPAPVTSPAPSVSPVPAGRRQVLVCPPALDPDRVTIMPIVEPVVPIVPVGLVRDGLVPVTDPIARIMVG